MPRDVPMTNHAGEEPSGPGPARLRDRVRGEFVALGVAVGSGVGVAVRSATGVSSTMPIVLGAGILLGMIAAIALRRP